LPHFYSTGRSLTEVNIRQRKKTNDTSKGLTLKKLKENNIHQSDSDSLTSDDNPIRNLNLDNDIENYLESK
jgi:hypothetical protein